MTEKKLNLTITVRGTIPEPSGPSSFITEFTYLLRNEILKSFPGFEVTVPGITVVTNEVAIIPAFFKEDAVRRNHWHITNQNGVAFCGADLGNVEWHLPDEPFIEGLNLCLGCWELAAVDPGMRFFNRANLPQEETIQAA